MSYLILFFDVMNPYKIIKMAVVGLNAYHFYDLPFFGNVAVNTFSLFLSPFFFLVEIQDFELY